MQETSCCSELGHAGMDENEREIDTPKQSKSACIRNDYTSHMTADFNMEMYL